MRNKNFKEVKETKEFIYMPKTYYNIVYGLVLAICGFVGIIKFNDNRETLNFMFSCAFFIAGIAQLFIGLVLPAKYKEEIMLCDNLEDTLDADFDNNINVELIYDNEEKIVLRKNIYYTVFNWFLFKKVGCIEVHSKKFKEIEKEFFNDK